MLLVHEEEIVRGTPQIDKNSRNVFTLFAESDVHDVLIYLREGCPIA